jgi:deoxyribonuclease V
VAIAALDVDYRAEAAVTACVVFETWSDEHVRESFTVTSPAAAEYAPGAFYLRELPCLLAALARCAAPPTTVVVDGHVWLGEGRPGLGAHLHRALGEAVPVIGVAKNPFRGAPAHEVLRGDSRRPLFVTAIGMPGEAAATLVAGMHGPHRVPTLLRLVDQLCRRG